MLPSITSTKTQILQNRGTLIDNPHIDSLISDIFLLRDDYIIPFGDDDDEKEVLLLHQKMLKALNMLALTSSNNEYNLENEIQQKKTLQNYLSSSTTHLEKKQHHQQFDDLTQPLKYNFPSYPKINFGREILVSSFLSDEEAIYRDDITACKQATEVANVLAISAHQLEDRKRMIIGKEGKNKSQRGEGEKDVLKENNYYDHDDFEGSLQYNNYNNELQKVDKATNLIACKLTYQLEKRQQQLKEQMEGTLQRLKDVETYW